MEKKEAVCASLWLKRHEQTPLSRAAGQHLTWELLLFVCFFLSLLNLYKLRAAWWGTILQRGQYWQRILFCQPTIWNDAICRLPLSCLSTRSIDRRPVVLSVPLCVCSIAQRTEESICWRTDCLIFTAREFYPTGSPQNILFSASRKKSSGLVLQWSPRKPNIQWIWQIIWIHFWWRSLFGALLNNCILLYNISAVQPRILQTNFYVHWSLKTVCFSPLEIVLYAYKDL